MSDVQNIAQLYEDIRRDTVPVIHSVEGIAHWLAEVVLPRKSSRVYELGNEIVGWVDVHDGWLDQLYCKRGSTGKGIGL